MTPPINLDTILKMFIDTIDKVNELGIYSIDLHIPLWIAHSSKLLRRKKHSKYTRELIKTLSAKLSTVIVMETNPVGDTEVYEIRSK